MASSWGGHAAGEHRPHVQPPERRSAEERARTWTAQSRSTLARAS
eukprot:CAMPEP_0185161596 /NCGR_PEP_ID=MMETSP1139-20130426/5220_1 /TAXON_ID=298111 /ORGANISM="Pavlova sp., Strain CCMP459" /LENGTH=44 /DNA_ID= /DNA_START= /DNA_END= /DNA_ORIENTATION=